MFGCALRECPIVLQAHPLATTALAMRLILQNLPGRGRMSFNGNPAVMQRFVDLPEQERAALGILDGHINFGIDESLSTPALYMTMLRDPVESVIAFYYLVLGSPAHYLNPLVTSNKWTLKDLALAGRVELDNPMVRRLNPAPHPQTPATRIPFGGITREMLETAKRNLEERYLFGITERFDESLILFAQVMGWEDMFYIGPNAGKPPDLPLAGGEDPGAIRAIREISPLDLELYEFALGLFERRIAAACPNFERDLRAFRDENQRRVGATIGGVPADLGPPPPPPPERNIVWIASYPRSGNSWLRFLLDAYFFPPAKRLSDIGRLSLELDFWLEASRAAGLPEVWMVQAAEYLRGNNPRPPECPSGPMFKTHFLFGARHPLADRTRAAVYLYRDPRDVLFSGLNYTDLTSGAAEADQRQYARSFIRAGGDPAWVGGGYGTWAENLASWLAPPPHEPHPFPGGVLGVRYEDLKADTPGHLARILEFLGVAPDPARVQQAVERCTIDRLRNLEVATRATDAITGLRNKDKFFFHKGLSGQSLAPLGADIQAEFEARFGADLKRWGY